MKKTLKGRLQIRFVILTMLSLLVIQCLIVAVSTVNNYHDLVVKSDMLISQLHNNPAGGSRYFSVKIPTGKNTAYPDVVQHVSVTTEDATSLSRRVLERKQVSGFIDGYRYRIYQNESGTRIYFLLRESSIEMCKTAVENMILVSVISLIAIGALLIPLSGYVVQPFVENQRKQKEFITSASHAIKTPLTVISTNAQLLQSEIGENEWLTGIQKQVADLTQMTHGLVALSKSEEYTNPPVRVRFSFSEALGDAVEAYRHIASQNGIQVAYLPQPNMEYFGSKAEIMQLMQILLDNACKYCPSGGRICIQSKRSFHGVCLSVTNTAEPLQTEDARLLIQRFQRGQNAAGKAGFGLGLAIAETIAKRHDGHLTVSVSTSGEFRVEAVLR